MTIFELLYSLAIDIRTKPEYRRLTKHHEPNIEKAEQDIQDAILQDVFPGENTSSDWRIFRIFCFNYVNRAQAQISFRSQKNSDAVKMLLAAADNCCSDEEKIASVVSAAARELSGRNREKMIAALTKLTAKEVLDELDGLSYLDWIKNRLSYWSSLQNVHQVNFNVLYEDLLTLAHDRRRTKIVGMGIPLAANFFADCGLKAFVKPDLHVAPISNLLTLSWDEKTAIKGILEISKVESNEVLKNYKFEWLKEKNGLWPRYLDRVIYLIGSDSFTLDDKKAKKWAEYRRKLMRKTLIANQKINALYSRIGD